MDNMILPIRMSIALLILAQILHPSNANLAQLNEAGKVRVVHKSDIDLSLEAWFKRMAFLTNKSYSIIFLDF